ncbi:hypothetical protein J7E62_26510 [Variovorax paradoxus]|nr:hypothetical protein [Variovorax paradoxus]
MRKRQYSARVSCAPAWLLKWRNAPSTEASPLAKERVGSAMTEMVVHVEGSTPEQRARGVAAAQEVFERAGVEPWATAKAHFKRAGESLQPSDVESSLTEEEGRLAHLFDEAEEAALAACCEEWDAVPPDSYFQLLKPPGV